MSQQERTNSQETKVASRQERSQPALQQSSFQYATFEDTADSLHLPHQYWGHPIVNEFVTLFNRAEELQIALSGAQGERQNLVQLREYLGAPDITLSLADRYCTAELLLRCAIHILREGLGEPAVDYRGYLVAKLNTALGQFNLQTVKVPHT